MLFCILSYWLLVAGTKADCPNVRDTPNQTRKLRMEAIKVQILSKLRITSEVSSNITRQNLNFHTRWQLDDYYNEFKKKQRDSVRERYHSDPHNYFSKTIKVFRFPEETILTPNTRHYQFDTTLGRYMTAGATLKIGISQREAGRDPRRMTVKLYKLTQPLADFQADMSGAEELLDRPTHVERIKKIKGSNSRTFDFDLQLTFTRWSQWSETNHGLLICVGKCFQDAPEINYEEVFDGNNESNRPLLSIDTYEAEENHSRKKRSGYDCVNPRQQKKCCRYHYFVKFADLGMDWILAPDGYDAYYCSGDCPFMYLAEQKSSLYYTFVIARANYNNPMASPRPCCTPASLSDLSIMFSSGKVDSTGQPLDVEIHNLEDMVVDECGCS
uniref:TGF-beta ligand n=1 Tax=Mnemiopsis leidyi TaxID=27923 RepID=G5CTK9_MNELE|nr:TGF-beta ligand [Mnemiopsis leidyi]